MGHHFGRVRMNSEANSKRLRPFENFNKLKKKNVYAVMIIKLNIRYFLKS